MSIHVKPKGSNKQDGLTVDGTPYELDNSKAYDIASESMTVNVYNDSVKKGKAMGRWWISIEATGATIADSHSDLSGIASPATPDTPTPPYSVTNFYVWGLDLSGSLQGAGGIGGLLATIRPDPTNSLQSTAYLYSYDGNGNISEYINDQGATAAHYEYSPFGETIVATGPLAKENPFRFSTKYFVDELGIGDWGRRWYHPDEGRFMNKDLAEEEGGLNLYAFVDNDATDYVDTDGRFKFGPFGEVAIRGGGKGGGKNGGGPSNPDPGILSCLGEILWTAYQMLPPSPATGSQAHCVASCRVASACGKSLSTFLGNTQEYLNLLTSMYEQIAILQGVTPEPGLFQDSVEDLMNNMTGRNCTDDPCRTCEECCSDEVP